MVNVAYAVCHPSSQVPALLGFVQIKYLSERSRGTRIGALEQSHQADFRYRVGKPVASSSLNWLSAVT